MASNHPPLPPVPVLVGQRVDRLLSLARDIVKTDETRAIRYVSLAIRLSTRHRFSLGRAHKRLFCAACHRPWIMGYNLTVRLRPRTRRAEYKCACGQSRFFAYSPKKTNADAALSTHLAAGAHPSMPSSSPAGGKRVLQPFKRNGC